MANDFKKNKGNVVIDVPHVGMRLNLGNPEIKSTCPEEETNIYDEIVLNYETSSSEDSETGETVTEMKLVDKEFPSTPKQGTDDYNVFMNPQFKNLRAAYMKGDAIEKAKLLEDKKEKDAKKTVALKKNQNKKKVAAKTRIVKSVILPVPKSTTAKVVAQDAKQNKAKRQKTEKTSHLKIGEETTYFGKKSSHHKIDTDIRRVGDISHHKTGTDTRRGEEMIYYDKDSSHLKIGTDTRGDEKTNEQRPDERKTGINVRRDQKGTVIKNDVTVSGGNHPGFYRDRKTGDIMRPTPDLKDKYQHRREDTAPRRYLPHYTRDDPESYHREDDYRSMFEEIGTVLHNITDLKHHLFDLLTDKRPHHI